MRAQTASTIMRRRDFVTVLTGVAATLPVTALAQHVPAVPVVGYLNGASAAQFPQLLAGFHKGLGKPAIPKAATWRSNIATQRVNMIGWPHWQPTSRFDCVDRRRTDRQ